MLTILQNLLEARTNPSEAAKVLIDELGVKITASSITKEIQEHSNYPSLVSITDILTNYGIDNISFKVDIERLNDVPVPFLSPIKGEKNSTQFFTVVREVLENNLIIYDPEKHKWITITKENFLQRFSGIILLTEGKDTVKVEEKNYVKKLKEEKQKAFNSQIILLFIPFILTIECINAFKQNGVQSTLPIIFIMITFLGAIIGALLLWYELDQYNPMLRKICSGSRKVNCGTILKSKAAKIAGISWSSIGFSYFMGQLLLLLLTAITNSKILYIESWINVLALPYVFFSIYYQWKVAKQWCVLCLSVQGLLILQFITALIGNWHSIYSVYEINIYLITIVAVAFAVPFTTVSVIVPALEKAKEGRNSKTELQRLKHTPQIFEMLLSLQKSITVPSKQLGILLGNPDAKYKIIKVCNPYCGPCARAHTPMEELLKNNLDVQIQIIFTAFDNDYDPSAKVARHLLAIQEKYDQSEVKRALDYWYLAEVKNYQAFNNKYPMNGEVKKQNWKIKAMRDWCDKMEIEYTPSFFINGRQLPTMYDVNDLKYFLNV